MKQQPKKVSASLLEAIEHGELSRYRLAQVADVTESTLSRFVAGKGMSVDNIDRVCEALGLELVARKKPKKRATNG